MLATTAAIDARMQIVSKRVHGEEEMYILTSPHSTTGARMGDIHAYDHGRHAVQPSPAPLIQFVINATHFHVNL